jgi:teichuronic acid exporter
MTDSIKKKAVSAIRWTVAGRITSQILTWISTILIIRLLEPADYGLMALAAVSYSILMLLTKAGMSTGIIQAKDITKDQIRDLLGFLVVVNFVIFALHLLLAQLAAQYYNNPDIIPIMTVLSFTFLFIPWMSVPEAVLSREMKFKAKSLIDLFAEISASVVSLIMAFSGFGIWALVFPMLFRPFVKMLSYNRYCDAPIVPGFNFHGIGHLLKFGTFVTIGGVVWMAYSQVGVFIGGHFLDAAVIGLYSVALFIAELPVSKIMPLVNQVLLPTLSMIKNQDKDIKQNVLYVIRVLTSIMFPMLLLVSALSIEVTNILFGDKWEGLALLLALVVLVMPLRLVMNIFTPVVRAVGRPEIALRSALFMLALLVPSTLYLVQWGALGLCLSWVITIPLGFIYTVHRSATLVESSLMEVIKTILPYLLTSVISAAVVYAVLQLPELAGIHDFVKLSAGGTLGVCLYLWMGWQFNRSRFDETVHFIKTVISRKQ